MHGKNEIRPIYHFIMFYDAILSSMKKQSVYITSHDEIQIRNSHTGQVN